MTIKIKPTSTTATIEHNDSTILTIDSSGNITPSNQMYPKVPAFKVRQSSNQSVTNSTWTKVTYGTEYYDEGSDYNTTTDRFVAPINGVYNFSVTVRIDSTSPLRLLGAFYKNGSEEFVAHYDRETSSSVMMWSFSTDLKLSADDYIEVYIYSQSTSPSLTFGNERSCNALSGHLVSV